MILIIDNYDSFVYNLAQYLGELGREPGVFRNDQITLADIEELAPSHIVISPGPCTPHAPLWKLAFPTMWCVILVGKSPYLGYVWGINALAMPMEVGLAALHQSMAGHPSSTMMAKPFIRV